MQASQQLQHTPVSRAALERAKEHKTAGTRCLLSTKPSDERIFPTEIRPNLSDVRTKSAINEKNVTRQKNACEISGTTSGTSSPNYFLHQTD